MQKNAKSELKPDLGLRSWDELNKEEKLIIWQHLDWYFFDKDKTYADGGYSRQLVYKFYGEYNEIEDKKRRILFSIKAMFSAYRVQNYTPNFLEDMNQESACKDFISIFLTQNEAVVLELLSLYCGGLLLEISKKQPWREKSESDAQFKERTEKWRAEIFEEFSKRINEVFSDFGISVHLTHQGFIPRQDKKIVENLFEPVLSSLAGQEWQPVNEHLEDAFKDFTKKDFSGSIRNTVSSMQAFLQILVHGNIGKGNISELIVTAQSKSLIPNDVFSSQIFKNIESILARERQSKSGAHPKTELADEKTAKMILNLCMVFIQHCATNK